MIILLTGLPGVGKGTQAELIKKEYNIEHLSTGDIFRELIKENTDLSKELKSYMNFGKLVPDELTIKVLKNELSKSKYKKGFLIDGFPRTIEQAKFLNDLFVDEDLTIDSIINLHLDEDIIKKRLLNRLICLNCKGTFNKLNVAYDDKCPNCGHKLVKREDDTIEKIEERLKVAKKQTLPVISYYGDKVQTIDVNNQSKEETFLEIKERIKNDRNKI